MSQPRVLGLHNGQIVAVQVALAAIGYAVVNRGGGTAWLVPVGGGLAALAVLRWRGRWLYEWLPLAAGRLTGRRVGTADGSRILAGLHPGAVIEEADDGYGVLVTTDGHTALLALGHPSDLVVEGDLAADGWADAIAATVSRADPQAQMPAVAVQLLVHAVPAPLARLADTVAGASYRQLTDGQIPAQRRAWLAVTARRGGPAWTEEWLRVAVLGAAGKAQRELVKAGLHGRPVTADEYRVALAEIMGLTGSTGGALRSHWAGLGHGEHALYPVRLHRWPTRPVPGGLLRTLSAIPAGTVTTALALDAPGQRPGALRAGVALRLTGPGRQLGEATGALRQRLSGSGGALRRYPGEQLTGLIDTMPLGAPVRAGHRASAAALGALGSPLGQAGLLLGRNRRDVPVTLSLLRAEPTRAVLFGGPTVAGLLSLRALGLGAQLGIQTTRAERWSAFERGAAGLPLHLVALGQPLALAPASEHRPQLILTDAGRHLVDLPPDTQAWRSHLLVRDELTRYDLDALAHADLVLLQPLPPEAASLIGTALGLPEAADWLPRIRPDMVAVIARTADGRRPLVRWARLTMTPTESQLLVTAS